MSAGTRMPLSWARVEADHFRQLFAGCYARWEVAGSIRRCRQEVGDVEHVVIATIGRPAEPDGESMFAPAPALCSLLWHRCDALLAMGIVGQAVYSDGRHRWGEKMRGVEYRGVRHEIYTASGETWVPQLVIRTGPAELSQRLVTELKGRGRYVQDDGVRYVGGPCAGQVRAVKDEREYFDLCGIVYMAPESRG